MCAFSPLAFLISPVVASYLRLDRLLIYTLFDVASFSIISKPVLVTMFYQLLVMLFTVLSITGCTIVSAASRNPVC